MFGSVFSSASLRLYGRYSYFVYIFEVMLISTVVGWIIHGAWSARTPSNLVEVVLAFVLPLPFAWLLWRFIEAPLLQIGHRFAYA